MSEVAKPFGISDAHIERFAQRATWLRRAAYLIIFVIFILIVAGALVYQQAANIAARDVGGGVEPTHSSLEELNITKDSLEKEIGLVTKTRDAFRDQFEVGQRTLLEVLDIESQLSVLTGKHALLLTKIEAFGKSGAPVNVNSISTLEELTAARDNLAEFSVIVETITKLVKERVERGSGSRADATLAEQRLQSVIGNLQLLNQRIDSFAVQDDTAGTPGSAELPIIIQTNITRFGTLIVIFFFISILVPIYRYNIQSAAFYDAVSDALILVRDTGDGDISSLIGVLTPSVSFGKSPETPIQQSAELAKLLARSRSA